ncbi:MAG TPA: glycosyltransferase [Williamwhitmania sp.]|nr:glycosyltransferase [Williamwhitmania sp.]
MSRRVLDIIHIYAGTSGSAGTYIHEIYTSLSLNYKQEIFVNYYFPFMYGKKYFYRFSELSAPYTFLRKNQSIRHIIRYVELLLSLIRILSYVLKCEVKIVNYSLTSDLRIEYWFLSILSFFNISIAITCHDVIPFGLNDINNEKKIKTKKKFFDLADYLIVHNDNSSEELILTYGIALKKIFKYPFPVMNLCNFPITGIENIPDIFKSKDGSTFRVGMVGHFRKEKGLDTLLKAWDLFYDHTKESELLLVGNFPDGIDTKRISDSKGIYVFDQFVDDSTYVSVIKNCDLIVLPYVKGTNSGIPSSVISLGTLLVTSNIEMFKNNTLINNNYLFHSENAEELSDKIMTFYSLSNEERILLVNENKKLLMKYIVEFNKSINDCFKVLMENSLH